MAGLFRRPQQAPMTSVSREEIEALLPASVRQPETNRFTPLGSDFDGEEGSDEDIEFLESIVKAVEDGEEPMPRPVAAPAPAVAPAPLTVTTPSPARRIMSPDADELLLFRETQADHRERTVLEARADIEDVELFDLLEDLATTAAALGRRKAA